MAEIATIARPYAEAAFQLADAQGKLAEWSAVFAAFARVAADPQIQSIAGNPGVPGAKLEEIIVAATGGAVPQEARQFLRTVIENRRLPALPEMSTQFETLKREREGVVEAEVRTAYPLEPAQLAALVADLESRFKRKVNPVVTVDESLIGGVRVTVGDEVLDASVRGKLAQIAAALTH